MFNEARLYERVMDGELSEEVQDERHLSRRQASRVNQRHCTSSQVVAYYDRDGHKLAVVHQYMRRNRIGGSGRPDPKWLRIGNQAYAPLPE